MKKILSVLVCVCVLLSAMVFTASAAETASYVKVTEAPADWSGDYLIVYEDGANTRVLNGGLSTIDAEGNYIKVAMTDGVIEANDTTNAAKFTVEKYNNGYSLKSASGYYMGNTSNQNKIITNKTTKYENTLTLKSDDTVDVVSAGSYLRSNIATTNGNRFRYYKSSSYTNQKAICLYKLVTAAGDEGGDEPTCEHTATSAVPNGDETHKLVCDACSETTTPAVDCTDADVNGKCDVCEGNVAIPVQDPAADSTLSIVDAAALGASKEHNTYTEGKYYITGKISAFQSNANATKYGNFYLADDAGNQILIYGLYSEDGEVRYDAMETKPVAGDTVKLYGVLGQYSGTAQMKSAWLIEHTPATTPGEGGNEGEDTPAVLPAPDETNTLTITEATELGAAQETGAYTADKYYVTGQVVSVSNTQYGNMYIADEDGNEILVYGTYSADGELRYDAMETKPDEGDTVTVYGIVGNYNGTPQLKNAWIIEFTEGELDVETPTEPEADSVLSITEALELGLTKRHNEYTADKYYITGKVVEYSTNYETYGNMFIEDAEGNRILVYGMYSEDGEIRYDELEDKPEIGDTITVYGVIGQYNGTPQMKNGWLKAAPATDDGENDTTGGTTGGTTNGDNGTTSPVTGDNVGAIVALSMAAAAAIICTKKRR